MIVTAGATNKSVYFYVQEDAGNTNPGEPATGIAFGSLTSASYARSQAARVAITPATQTPAGAHSDGGWVEVDATNMPGTYRFDPPDAAFAAGADQVTIQVVPGAGFVCAPVIVDLTDVDLQDSVRGGMTALPNAAAEAAGGLYTRGTGAGQINQAANGQVDVNIQRLNNVAQSLLDLVDFADAGYDPATNKVEGVKTVDTTTANTDMRGTDSAALALVCTEERLSELDAATAGKAANQIDLIKTEADKIALVDAGAGVAGSVIEEVENRATQAQILSDATPFAGANIAAIKTETDKIALADAGTGFAGSVIEEVENNAAAIAALNDLSAAQVNTECDTALSDAGVNETRMSELDAGTAGKMANQVDIIQTDTTTDIPALLPAALVGGRMDCSVGAMAANVVTSGAIATDAIGADEFAQAAADKVFGSSGAALAELSVGAPSATPRPDQALMLLYMALRNKLDITSSIMEIHNDAGTIVATKALTDDGSTYSEAEMISG